MYLVTPSFLEKVTKIRRDDYLLDVCLFRVLSFGEES